MKRIFVDRSRYESYGRCPRQRYLEYHQGGMGIVPVRKPLPLCVGSSVHVGLAEMLQRGAALDSVALGSFSRIADGIEHEAVTAALADFAQYESAIDVDTGEIASRAALPADAPALSEMDGYLYREQSALVEGILRAYARRRLRPLLEEYEVLEVEREGTWKLATIERKTSCSACLGIGRGMDYNHCRVCGGQGRRTFEYEDIFFMSRPDALLRGRSDNQLYLLSFKTAASWDVRKARDAEHDMQGMSEGIEVERRLGEAWSTMAGGWSGKPEDLGLGDATFKYVIGCDAPPRIHAVRMEYLLKGERWKDRDLSQQFGMDMRSQKSHLIRKYVATSVPQKGTAGYSIGDECWSWDYTREDGKESSLAWQNWKSRPVWESAGGVKGWIDKLDETAVLMSGEDSTMGMEPREMGYGGPAQALGTTKAHPLDSVFIPPIIIYRNDDETRDLVEQLESAERRIAEGVAAVESALNEGERRQALNIHFPQTRRACEYPTTCAYSKVCFGGEDIKRDPIGSGLYKIRRPNHPQEKSHD